MALIGTIRKNGWILIVLMTLALGGFIAMEIYSNIQRNSAGDVNTIGRVNGQEIKRSDFDTYEKLVYTNSRSNPYQIRSQVWNYFVENALITEIADDLGLGVPKDELKDLEFGDNLSPVITDRFKGENGQVNLNNLMQIKAAIEGGQFTDPQYRAYWSIQEKEIVKQRLQDKLTGMVLKGLYTPTWQAEMAFRETNERLDFKYVRVPFERVPDTDVQITEEDYKNFLKEYPGLYDQTEETRTLNFLVFDVAPSATDSSAARENVAKLVDGLRTTTNDSTFAIANNGVYDQNFRSKTELPSTVADSLMKVPVGTVLGPFLEAGNYTIAKVLERKLVPDSVSARHILIRDATPANERKIDSLRALIESGKARFDSLAVRNSQDPGSAAKGGNLGYMANGRTVPEFNNVLFNTGEQGKLYKVSTQFGWHLIEITGKKFIKNEASVRCVFISSELAPSDATQKVFEDRAASISQQAKSLTDLQNIASQQGLQLQTSSPLKANDFALSQSVTGEGIRDIIRWAYDKKTKVGDVSKEVFSLREQGVYYNSKYVVAALKNVIPGGAATVESIKGQPRVDNEIRSRKKGQIIIDKSTNKSDLMGFAGQWQVSVDTAKMTNFFQSAAQGIGSEPRVFGTVFSLNKDAVGGPVIGNTGVFLVQPISDRTPVTIPSDLSYPRRQATSMAGSAIRMNLMSEIKKNSEIKDFRSKFF